MRRTPINEDTESPLNRQRLAEQAAAETPDGKPAPEEVWAERSALIDALHASRRQPDTELAWLTMLPNPDAAQTS